MKRIFILYILILGCFILTAQEVVSSGGEAGTAAGYEISWTVGEPVIETVSDGTNTLTQGFHQTKLTVTSVNEFSISGIELKVFPNPTEDYVHIHISEVVEEVSYAIYNSLGSLVEKKEIISTKTKLNFTPYASGTYILRLNRNTNEPLQTFKIIKR
ncbi:MAG: T9SS type A sorting domain-containing protein [Bacteroidota bacterium]